MNHNSNSTSNSKSSERPFHHRAAEEYSRDIFDPVVAPLLNGISVQDAASIFRTSDHSPYSYESNDNVYNNQPMASMGLNLSPETSLGYLMENLHDFYPSHETGNGEDVLEPIPLKFWQAQGVAVGIDNSTTTPEKSIDTHVSSLMTQGKDGALDFMVSQSLSINPSVEEQRETTNIQHPFEMSRNPEPTDGHLNAFATPSNALKNKGNSPREVVLQQEEMEAPKSAATQCISPDPSMREFSTTDRVGLKRKLSMAMASTVSQDADKRIKTLPDVIGPNAPQMAPIYCFLEYLKADKSSFDTYATMQEIVDECHKKHVKGAHRCRNLPGAILERAIKLFGGPEFQRMYSACQQQQQQQQKNNIQEPTAATFDKEDNATKLSPQSKAISTTRRQRTGPITAHVPSLVEAAVGYGFHLARTHFLHNNNTTDRMSDVLMQGVDTVNRMSDSERARFWKYMISSSVCERVNAPAPQPEPVHPNVPSTAE